jgi:DNA-binding winged helix-turn-helix (wHTH) protein
MADLVSSHGKERDLRAWLKAHGFTENPFALCEASREARLSEYFVEGPHYDEVKGIASDPRTAFVFAARGCGKSAYRVMIQGSCRPDDRESTVLAIPYTDFRRVLDDVKGDLSQIAFNHHLQAIIASGLTTLLREFVESPHSFLELPRKRRGVFKALVAQHAPDLLHPTFLSDHLREWRKDQAADLLEEATEQDPPSRLLSSTSELLPRFLYTFLVELPESLPSSASLIKHWQSLAALTRRAGLKAVYVLVDRLDEFAEMAIEDPTSAATFLLPLVADLPLMETPYVAFKFFLPIEVLHQTAARFDRLEWYPLEWQDDHLKRMLISRLQAFSGGSVPSLDALADVSVAGRIDNQLIRWAFGSPRNLLLLGETLLIIHCDRESDPESPLTEKDLEGVMARFERQFGPLVPPLGVDEKQRRVLIGEQPIKDELTLLEFDLLWFLYQNAGEVKSKDDLSTAVYEADEGVSNEAIDSLVFRLRQKIEKDPKNPVYLITQRGQGYRLTNVK